MAQAKSPQPPEVTRRAFLKRSDPAAFGESYAEYQLYDLYSDPHQLVNLAGRDGTLETSEDLRRRLLARIQEAGDRVADIKPPYFPYC